MLIRHRDKHLRGFSRENLSLTVQPPRPAYSPSLTLVECLQYFVGSSSVVGPLTCANHGISIFFFFFFFNLIRWTRCSIKHSVTKQMPQHFLTHSLFRCCNTFSYTTFFDVAIFPHTQPFSMLRYFLTHSLFRCCNTFSITTSYEVIFSVQVAYDILHPSCFLTQTPMIWYFTPKLQCFLTISLKEEHCQDRAMHYQQEKKGGGGGERKKKHHTNEKAKPTNQPTKQTNEQKHGGRYVFLQ